MYTPSASKHPKIGFDDRLNASPMPQLDRAYLSTFHYSVRTPGTVEGQESRPEAGRNDLSRSALCNAIWVLQELVLWVHGRDSCRWLFVGFLLTANAGHGVDRIDELASWQVGKLACRNAGGHDVGPRSAGPRPQFHALEPVYWRNTGACPRGNMAMSRVQTHVCIGG